jgi:esterase/lipase superfamily enzyme
VAGAIFMKENYHKWYSQWIGDDIEMLVFGEQGIPLLLFPQINTRYYDFKDFGVIEGLSEFIEDGILKVYCPDSIDPKLWFNNSLSPDKKVEKYEQFEQAIIHDIIGFANYETEEEKLIFSGFGFGAYYALNFVLKYPEWALGVLTIGGDFEVKNKLDGYFDEKSYYNSPLDYLFGLTDPKYINQYKKLKIVLSSGSLDDSFGQNKFISQLFFEKGVNHLFDVYPYKLNTFDDCKQVLNNNLQHFLLDH